MPAPRLPPTAPPMTAPETAPRAAEFCASASANGIIVISVPRTRVTKAHRIARTSTSIVAFHSASSRNESPIFRSWLELDWILEVSPIGENPFCILAAMKAKDRNFEVGIALFTLRNFPTSASSPWQNARPETPSVLRRGRDAGRRAGSPDAPRLRAGASLSGSPRPRPRRWRRRR